MTHRADGSTSSAPDTRPRMPDRVLGGMSMAIGSLPHLSLVDAITLSVSASPEPGPMLPTTATRPFGVISIL